jgi:hypothetical protein
MVSLCGALDASAVDDTDAEEPGADSGMTRAVTTESCGLLDVGAETATGFGTDTFGEGGVAAEGLETTAVVGLGAAATEEAGEEVVDDAVEGEGSLAAWIAFRRAITDPSCLSDSPTFGRGGDGVVVFFGALYISALLRPFLKNHQIMIIKKADSQ